MPTKAWWDPDEMRTREADVRLPWWIKAALFVAVGATRMYLDPNYGSSCSPIDWGRFELLDASPYKSYWRCRRCGGTYTGISSDNPGDYHSC